MISNFILVGKPLLIKKYIKTLCNFLLHFSVACFGYNGDFTTLQKTKMPFKLLKIIYYDYADLS